MLKQFFLGCCSFQFKSVITKIDFVTKFDVSILKRKKYNQTGTVKTKFYVKFHLSIVQEVFGFTYNVLEFDSRFICVKFKNKPKPIKFVLSALVLPFYRHNLVKRDL